MKKGGERTDRRILVFALLLIVAGTAVLGAFLLTARATEAAPAINTNSAPSSSDNGGVLPPLDNHKMMFGGPGGQFGQGAGDMSGMMFAGPMRGPPGPGFMLNSTEFTAFVQSATDIAKSDSDVQNLLAQNYNITGVRPAMNNITHPVWGSNETATKPLTPTSAVVMLQKASSGQASVFVDLTQGKVTKIEIWTKTVIDKP